MTTTRAEWWIAHPWHVTGTPQSGNVPADCDCRGCFNRRYQGDLFSLNHAFRSGVCKWCGAKGYAASNSPCPAR